ncbi:MAG TPA: hypothetical protein VNG33_19205 [Polyangiaceae bacterium]|nr:hypothetical protein [Polyangiaceae bacterium]
MKVYVASSWRNPHQQKIVALLRHCRHEVYDFRNPPNGSGFSWQQLGFPEQPLGERRAWNAATLRQALEHPIAIAGHAADLQALDECDACVYVTPCGRSASWELGYAMAKGKFCFVLQLEEEEPELMLRGASILGSLAELVDVFARGQL